jgi:hypothetical protein
MKNIWIFLMCFILCIWSNPLRAITPDPKVGTRPLGMSAFSAVADDINAICWNPAGLALMPSQEAISSYAPLYGFDMEMSQSYLAYAYPTGKWGTAGLNFSYLTYGDMDWRDNSGVKLGEFSRKDYSVYASYGVRLIESLSLGASLGTVSINMDSIDDSATGIGLDLGALYTFFSRASLGLYLENIGGISASDREIARQKIRAGTAVAILNRQNMGLVIAADLEEQQGELDTLYSGFEWSVFAPSSFFIKRKLQQRYVNLLDYQGIADYQEGLPQQQSKISLCIRSGVRKRISADEPLAFSGGVSIRYIMLESLIVKLEHAFSWHPYLETTHRFSLGLEMGGTIYDR